MTTEYSSLERKYVYCSQHLRPHSTGWCTVSVRDKLPLKARTSEEAYKECRHFGLKIFKEHDEGNIRIQYRAIGNKASGLVEWRYWNDFDNCWSPMGRTDTKEDFKNKLLVYMQQNKFIELIPKHAKKEKNNGNP